MTQISIMETAAKITKTTKNWKAFPRTGVEALHGHWCREPLDPCKLKKELKLSIHMFQQEKNVQKGVCQCYLIRHWIIWPQSSIWNIIELLWKQKKNRTSTVSCFLVSSSWYPETQKEANLHHYEESLNLKSESSNLLGARPPLEKLFFTFLIFRS